MIEVIPLKYGVTFKRIFGKPEVFRQFATAVLGIPIMTENVHTEYEYPKPVGFVRSRYDLFAEDTEKRVIVEIQQAKEGDFFDRFFYYHLISLVEQVQGFKEYNFEHAVYTIVVLTSVPRDGSVTFSYAISSCNPIDEHGQVVAVYPHRLVFLVPRLANADTPPEIRRWLAFIEDSLDGKMDETSYPEDPFRSMLEDMRYTSISPDELAAIKDEAAWEMTKANFAAEERARGEAKGKAEGLAEGQLKGQIALLRRQLTRKFGELPDWVEPKLAQASATELEAWSEQVLEVESLSGVFADF